MTNIGLDTVVARGSEHVETTMVGQTVMMSVAHGKYFALDGTGLRVWECLTEPVSVGRIVEQLLDQYEVDREQCETEVIFFLSEMMKNGLTVEHGV
jgi:hypothetical protein